jgi:hypothetical protein
LRLGLVRESVSDANRVLLQQERLVHVISHTSVVPVSDDRLVPSGHRATGQTAKTAGGVEGVLHR